MRSNTMEQRGILFGRQPFGPCRSRYIACDSLETPFYEASCCALHCLLCSIKRYPFLNFHQVDHGTRSFPWRIQIVETTWKHDHFDRKFIVQPIPALATLLNNDTIKHNLQNTDMLANVYQQTKGIGCRIGLLQEEVPKNTCGKYSGLGAIDSVVPALLVNFH